MKIIWGDSWRWHWICVANQVYTSKHLPLMATLTHSFEIVESFLFWQTLATQWVFSQCHEMFAFDLMKDKGKYNVIRQILQWWQNAIFLLYPFIWHDTHNITPLSLSCTCFRFYYKQFTYFYNMYLAQAWIISHLSYKYVGQPYHYCKIDHGLMKNYYPL